MKAFIILSLLSGPVLCQVTEVPTLSAPVGANVGQAGAGLGGPSPGPAAPSLTLAAPTLTGGVLPSPVSPAAVGVQPVALSPLDLSLPSSAGGASGLKALTPGQRPVSVPKHTSAAPGDGGARTQAPAVGSKEFQQSLQEISGRADETRSLLEEPSGGEAAAEKGAGTGAIAFDRARVPTAEDGIDKAALQFARYARSIVGSSKLTRRQAQGLFTLWLEERGLDPGSPLALGVRSRIFPQEAAELRSKLERVSPELRAHAHLLVTLSDEYGVTPERTEALLRDKRLHGFVAGIREKSAAERALRSVLERDRVDRLVSGYPRNSQGAFLREMADSILTKSGKSVEEVSRAGAFAYADFNGRSVSKVTTGRDPDYTGCHVVFYVLLEDGRWRISGYRQNRVRGFPGGSDASYIESLKAWLVAGGIPSEALAP